MYKPGNSLSLILLCLSFQTIKPQQFAIFVLLRIVIECFLQREDFHPWDFRPGLGHPKLTGASRYCRSLPVRVVYTADLDFVFYVWFMDA